MAAETRPSKRPRPTPSAGIALSSGNLITKRSTLGPNGQTVLTIPNGARFGIFKNSGTSLIKFLAGLDDTQYFSLTGTQITPVVEVVEGQSITIENSGGPGTIECMFWG